MSFLGGCTSGAHSGASGGTSTPPPVNLLNSLTYSSNPAVYVAGSAIANNTATCLGGTVESYTVTPALPAGLALDTSTGVISGIPTAVKATATYTVTATNSGGSTMVGVSITVNDAAPSGLSYSANPAVYIKGSAITADTPTHGGGTVISFAVSPALPAGLALNTGTGIISGTPTTVTATATHTVTATNGTGSTTADVSITVNDAAPTGLTYNTNPAVYTKGSAITVNTLTHGGGTVVAYAVSPSLPAGLSLSTTTGAIVGTPTAFTASATYTVTATNTGGSATVVVSIAVNDVAPGGLTYSASPAVYTKDTPISNNVPSLSKGGPVVSYAVSPALPTGLALDASTGVISGTPTTVAAVATFTVTAVNSGGSTTAKVSITIKDLAPTGLTYSANPAVYTKGTLIPGNVPSLGGGGPVSAYTVAPALPAGLILSTSTGSISGIPTAVSATTTYTVTATNGSGSTTATVSIAVNDLAPTGLTYSTDPAVYTKGSAIPANTPAHGGGTVVSYAAAPALPAGLALNPGTGAITGTPTAVAATATYIITATNSGGSTMDTVSITVKDLAPTTLTYSNNPAVYTNGSAIAANSPIHGGGTVVSYAVAPALPVGLTMNPSTGVISGTATALAATATYLVTATNSGGSTTVNVSITVKDVAPTGLTYNADPAVYTKGTPIANNLPNLGGGPVLSYVVAPALPAGLTLNPGTGVISGTPTAVTAVATYTVTATNTGGSTTSGVSIKVNDVAPSGLTYGANPAVYVKGTLITSNIPSLGGGGPVVSYSVFPTLPVGLVLNSGTGIISGTPTAVAATTIYTVTAMNSGGSSTAGVSLTVNDVAPSGLTYSPNPALYTKGSAISASSPVHGGGTVVSYTVAPALPPGLAVNPGTGAISGTPTAVTALATYTVTASNSGGSTTAGVSITIKDVAPSTLTYSPNPAVYTIGSAIPANTPTHGGGAVVSFVVAPALPLGLALDTSTGIISGTPTAVTALAAYTVTATNTGGSGTVNVSITVKDLPPTGLTYSTNPAVYTKGSLIANNTPSLGGGGPVVSFAVSPALPAGLALDTNTGVISGNPTAVKATTTYTVTATNSGGSTTTVVNLTVNDVAPTGLTYSTDPAVYTKGSAITNNTPTHGGGAVVSYAVSPALPAGLILNAGTGIISGSPSVVTALATYTITATNTGGSTPVSVTLTVNDAAPTALTYSPNPAAYNKSSAITSTPTHGGGAVVSYAVSPALPAGLVLNTGTGVISGTPTAMTALAVYTVTATNTGGSTTAGVTLTVNDAPPSGLTYSASPAVYTKGSPITNNTPALGGGGPVLSFAVSPALPAGLALDTITGVISGTPTAVTGTATYTVTATNSGGGTTNGLSIRVNDVAPSGLTYGANPAVYAKGSLITTNTPSLGGSGPVVSYTVAPALPAGLTLNPGTGLISGTPTAVAALAVYTVTATNTGGSTTAGVTLTVNDVPPSALTYLANPAIYTKGSVITANTAAHGGGTVVSYAVSPALPAGLTLNAGTGGISGTPTVVTASATYTVTATNSGGSTTAGVTLTVKDIPPSGLTYSRNPAIYATDSVIPANTPTNTGGAVVSYAVSPALPVGLALDTSTGVISGTPTSLTATATYTVTAINSGGSTFIGVSITVISPPVITAQPTNAHIVGGATATFSVAASGTGPLSYQWQRNGSDIIGANATSCTTPTLSRSDYGTTYRAVVSDAYGGITASANATLTLGLFTYTSGNLVTGLTGATSTLLPNGKVLITGGDTGILTAKLYDPATRTFSATGDMGATRWAHTATLLPNGKVLVVGGYVDKSATPPTVTSAELYDPASGTFTATGAPVTPRAQHTATLLPNGKVLLAGGNGVYNGTALQDAELYDPTTGTFSATLGNMNTGRIIHSALLLPNGMILITGGYNAGALNSAELYDPAAMTFTSTTGDLQTNRFRHSATLLPNGKVLIAGGQGASVGYLASAELYDPVAGTFTATGSLNTGRNAHSAALLPNGKVLITGGYNAAGLAELYDPAVGVFTPAAYLNTGRQENLATLLPNGKVLITGSDPSAELYDPEDLNLELFTATGGLGVARANQTATVLPNGKVLMAGGTNGVTLLASVELNDPATGIFSPTGGLGTARYLHTATCLGNGRVLIAGGSSGGCLASAETYDFTSGTFSPTAGSLGTARENHTATLLPEGNVLLTAGDDGLASLGSAELFDPSTGIFTATGSLGAARSQHTATLLPSGLVLITGGKNLGSAVTSAELFDPAAGTFTATGSLNTARYAHTATLLPNGLVLITGGNKAGSLASAELFDPAAGTFSATTGGLHLPRYAHTATLLPNGLVLIAGGNNSGSPLASAELFDPAAGTFRFTLDSLTTARQAHTATLLSNGLVLVAGGNNGTYIAGAELYQ